MSQEQRNIDLENERPNSLLSFLQRFSTFIIGFLGFATTVYQFVQLFRGNREDFTWILGGLGYLTILVSLIHIGFSKTKYLAKIMSPPQWFTRMTYEKHYINARKGIILLFATCLVCAVVLYKQDKERQDKFVVMIAEFDGPDTQNYRLTERLLFQLKDTLNGYDDTLIIPLNKKITEQDGSIKAQKIARKYRADLIIWGWYGVTDSDTLITMHIENLSPPKNIPIPSSASYAVQSPITEINNFQLQQKVSDEMTALSLFISGVARYENEDYTEAIKRLTSAYGIGNWPDNLTAKSIILFYRGNAHLNKSSTDTSTENINPSLANQPPPFIIPNFDNNELALAISDFTLVIQSSPDFEEAYINRGRTYLLLHSTLPDIDEMETDSQSPLSDFNKALSINPNNIDAYNARGTIYLLSKEYSNAISDFSQVIEIGQSINTSENLSFAYINRGGTYEWNGEFNNAISDYEKALDSLSQEDEITLLNVYGHLGNCYNEIGEPHTALEYINKAIDINSLWYQPYAFRGNSYEMLQEYQSAISDYTTALTLRDKFLPGEVTLVESLYIKKKRGEAYLQINDYENAINDFTEILETDTFLKPDPELYKNRATAYTAIGEKEKAEKDLEIASDIYFFIGIQLIEEESHDQALENLGKAINLSPNNAKVYVIRAAYHLTLMESEYLKTKSDTELIMAEFDLASDDVNKSIEIDPNIAEAYFIRGLIYLWFIENFDIKVIDYENDKWTWKVNGQETPIFMGDNDPKYNFLKVLELSEDPVLRNDAEENIEIFNTLIKQE